MPPQGAHSPGVSEKAARSRALYWGRRLTPAGGQGEPNKEVLVWPKFIGYTESPPPLTWGTRGESSEEMEVCTGSVSQSKKEKCLNRRKVQGARLIRPRPCRGRERQARGSERRSERETGGQWAGHGSATGWSPPLQGTGWRNEAVLL